MDTLTHALSGALLARATEAKEPRLDQLPRRARMWVGFWAAAFPDSDFITRFIDPLTYLTVHRGITHSVIMLPVWALGLSLLFMLLVRGKYSWRAFAGVLALGIGIHIVGDVITAFGTMIFAPFSTWRAQIPTTFIIDPYFTAIIVAGLVASLVWSLTRKPAIIGLPCSQLTSVFRESCISAPLRWERLTSPGIGWKPEMSRRFHSPFRHSTG